jgi:hypothetical protein
MEQVLIESQKKKPKNQKLGHEILTWAVCSRRPLSVKELVQALQPDSVIVMDPKLTISRVCGQFVVVDATDHLVMVHQTARDHSLETQSALAVNEAGRHEKLFKKCLSALETNYARTHADRRVPVRNPIDNEDIILYATTSWPYHLDRTPLDSDTVLLTLSDFLTGYSVLAWVTTLASKNLLRMLVSASKSLSRLVRVKRTKYVETNPMAHRLQELDNIERWATDFLKLLGKFGQNLVLSPSSIYHQIPPFCPKETAIYHHFERHNVEPFTLSVEGVTRVHWDDSLARLSLGSGSQALAVLCSPDFIAVLTGVGQIVLYNATTFEIMRTLVHKERVCAMNFSASFKHLATYGFRTTKIWDVKTGDILYQIQNPRGSKAFSLIFADGDTELIAGSDDRLIRVANLTTAKPNWSILHTSLLKDEVALDRPVHKIPWRISFSMDAKFVAVAYRGFPMSAFSLNPPEAIGRCMRSRDYAGNAWTVVDEMLWHPSGQDILGIYMNGQVFRWNPFENTQQEIAAEAKYLACSPDGRFFATGDRHGTIKVFNYDHFVLVYQLAVEGLINNICFSPDGKRLFDVRGHYCNV